MHIDVEELRRHLDEKECDRVLPFHQRGVITFTQTIANGRAVHWPAVEENKLHLPVGPAEPSSADEPTDGDTLVLRLDDRQQALRESPSDESFDTVRVISG